MGLLAMVNVWRPELKIASIYKMLALYLVRSKLITER